MAAVLQPAFLTKFSLPGATPDLVIVVLVTWAILKGPAVGAIAGFILGFLIDVIPPGNHLMGISSIFLATLGYLIGIIGGAQSKSFVRPIFISSSAAMLFFVIRTIWALLGGSNFSIYYFSINFLTQGIYAAFLMVFIFPLISGIDKKLGPNSRKDELRI
jgi:rod shape-determining protein MreD